MNAAGRRATPDYSRGFSPPPGRRSGLLGLRLLLLSGGFLGGGLLIAADFSTLYEVDVLTVVKAAVAGHSQHGYAVALIGLFACPMTVLAATRRPAMLGLGVLGVLALAVSAIAGDFHDIHSTGLVGRLYENATAAPKQGFYFETLGGVLLIAAGFGRLLLPTGRAPGAERRESAAGTGSDGPPPRLMDEAGPAAPPAGPAAPGPDRPRRRPGPGPPDAPTRRPAPPTEPPPAAGDEDAAWF
ncbi:MAG: hypothetical protein QOF77_1442 [Solirubrobacteraceae bacterium]|nr:hypothetical protein [Solirubrobacteraceae bacterium]